MWCDNFDGDLYQLVPEARGIIAPVADIKLRTWCRRPDRDGKLNHPAAWNGYDGMMAFFGRHMELFNPPGFICPGAKIIDCTAEEALRDLWVHQCIMHVDLEQVWRSHTLQQAMMDLLWIERRWPGYEERDADMARTMVEASLRLAVAAIYRIDRLPPRAESRA